MSSVDPMTSPARSAGGHSSRREGKFVRSPATAESPPSPMTSAEIAGAGGTAEFAIATPMRAPVAEVESLAKIVQNLTIQLEIAHGRIQELQGLLSGTVKELEMTEQMAEIKMQHAVFIAQAAWNDQWHQWHQSEEQAPSDADELQPAPPEPAPEASRFPELHLAAAAASRPAPPSVVPAA